MNESNKKKTVAIVCGGGPAPGINAVIAAVTLRARNVGFDVIGIYDGFSHLAKREKKYIPSWAARYCTCRATIQRRARMI